MNGQSARQHDDQLISRTLAGEREAFGDLVRQYQDRLYNGVVKILRNEAEAEDTVQEAFILALTKLNTFQGKSGFYTWLFRIAYNAAITRIRKRKPTMSLDGLANESQMQLPSDQPPPEAEMVRLERAERLMSALGQMSEEHRSILVLREMEEMDYSAISEVLELPVGTVRSRLHRARLQLKDILEKEMES